MTTNFNKIKQFHLAFGHPVNDTHQTKVFDQDPKLVKLRLDLIKEEVQELEEAINQKNFTEVIDALTDILYVTYGAGAAFGIDLDKAYNIVHESNMSKLCNNEQEAKQTIEEYKMKYKNGDEKYDSPNYKIAPDGLNYVVYNESSGKSLKSINYIPANFTSLEC